MLVGVIWAGETPCLVVEGGNEEDPIAPVAKCGWVPVCVGIIETAGLLAAARAARYFSL